MSDFTCTLIEALEKELPTSFTRPIVAKHLKGVLSVGHLANLDSQKLGPPSGRLGRCVVYERTSFLVWLRARLQPRQSGKIGSAKARA